jgi:hypothetical protein
MGIDGHQWLVNILSWNPSDLTILMSMVQPAIEV